MTALSLTRYEKDQLWQIGGLVYGSGRPYWWGRKTMPKLMAKGLVEAHPDHPKAWRITEAGRVARASMIESQSGPRLF